jgi:hypothetical protein
MACKQWQLIQLTSCLVIIGMLHGGVWVGFTDFAIGGAFVPVALATGEAFAIIDVH